MRLVAPTWGSRRAVLRGHLFIRGRIVRVVAEADMVAALVDEAEKLVAEGVEARLAAADHGAEAEAAADRAALLDLRGQDANDNHTRIQLIDKHLHQPPPTAATDAAATTNDSATMAGDQAADQTSANHETPEGHDNARGADARGADPQGDAGRADAQGDDRHE